MANAEQTANASNRSRVLLKVKQSVESDAVMTDEHIVDVDNGSHNTSSQPEPMDVDSVEIKQELDEGTNHKGSEATDNHTDERSEPAPTKQARTPITLKIVGSGASATVENGIQSESRMEYLLERGIASLSCFRDQSEVMTSVFPVLMKKHHLIVGRNAEGIDIDLSAVSSSRLVSHRHLAIRYEENTDMFVVTNMGRNGTKVKPSLDGQEQIHLGIDESFELRDSSILDLGLLQLRFNIIKQFAYLLLLLQ
eukprot:CAMPEP_0168534808 /NCGR_PEP_ID=MMETSP0405-20121227/18217_1 /TAXON_ID=498012 /ORGANISM="Trichosphaerium sp, Strain Am-I-7 wt" /LENGTH=251 /DNA_ID=CAMNT_0008561779 /DNA_START=127 /DNA_END=882 /DNA_ORIENTATION=+